MVVCCHFCFWTLYSVSRDPPLGLISSLQMQERGEKKMIYPGIVFIGLNIFARRKETDSSSLILVKSRCMEALWESIFLLAIHGGSFSRPCWVKALILSSKASLPCQTGISDWGGSITTLMWTASQRAKRKAGEGGTMAGPSHRICADQALNGRIDAAA